VAVDPDGDLEPSLLHRRVDVGEVTLHVVEAGPAGAPLVVLLHGFPEFWWSWRHQIHALSAAGYHVVAPDLRGFHLSDQPRAVESYRVEKLEADIAGLIHAFGAESAAVIGHDWGGALAWTFAHHYSRMVDRLGILNVPHPQRLRRGLRTLVQLRKSWYFFFFQLPRLPERWLSRGDFAVLRRRFVEDGLPAADAERFVEAARRSDRLRGGVNYYRASWRGWARKRTRRRTCIEAPTLVIWGEKDRYLGKELAVPDARLVPNARVEFLPAASHWVQQDAPERVNELLLDLLADPVVDRTAARDEAGASSPPRVG